MDIEIEQGFHTGSPSNTPSQARSHRHHGYYAGDFSETAMASPESMRTLVALWRRPTGCRPGLVDRWA